MDFNTATAIIQATDADWFRINDYGSWQDQAARVIAEAERIKLREIQGDDRYTKDGRLMWTRSEDKVLEEADKLIGLNFEIDIKAGKRVAEIVDIDFVKHSSGEFQIFYIAQYRGRRYRVTAASVRN